MISAGTAKRMTGDSGEKGGCFKRLTLVLGLGNPQALSKRAWDVARRIKRQKRLQLILLGFPQSNR